MDKVYVASGVGGNSTWYHTNPKCPKLSKADNTRPYDAERIRDRRKLCAVCDSSTPDNSDQDWSAYRSLRNASPDVTNSTVETLND